MRINSILVAFALAASVARPTTGAPILGAVLALGQAQSVQMLAEGFTAEGISAEGLESRLIGSCVDSDSAGDLTEALLLAGYDVYTVVHDVILACGTSGKSVEVASQAATRALFVKGESARYLIDAAVLGAAAEIERRRRAPVMATGVQDPVAIQARRDLDRERLERMMRKGLVDDEYREYIDEQRKQAEQVVLAGPAYSDQDAAVYAILYTLGLLAGGYYDDAMDIGVDAGGAASSQ